MRQPWLWSRFLVIVVPMAQVVLEAPAIFVEAPVLVNPTAQKDMVVMLVAAVLLSHLGPASPVAMMAHMLPIVMAIDEVMAGLVSTVNVVQMILVALKFLVIMARVVVEALVILVDASVLVNPTALLAMVVMLGVSLGGSRGPGAPGCCRGPGGPDSDGDPSCRGGGGGPPDCGLDDLGGSPSHFPLGRGVDELLITLVLMSSVLVENLVILVDDPVLVVLTP